jgi:tetratricopeptide (TPR) repeat protein
MKFVRNSAPVAAIVALLMALAPLPSVASNSPMVSFLEGMRSYRAEDFEAATVSFRRAVQSAPSVSDYHHWLGKAYGRMAERSSWLAALELANKTRESLERAVELNTRNVDALVSLMQFYSQAPGIVGGDPAKASELGERLYWLRQGYEARDASMLTR